MRHLLLGLVPCIVLIAACDSRSASAETANPVIAQWSGQYGGSDVGKTQVLRSATEWTAFWRGVQQDQPRSLNSPREMAVVIHLGEKRTGGFSAHILGVRRQDETMVVEYRESAPDPGMMVTQALASPWVVAVIPRSDLPVTFRKLATARPAPREK